MRSVISVTTTVLIAAVFTIMGMGPAFAGPSEAVGYVKARQNADGGFSEPDAASDVRLTCWSVIAGAAAGEDPASWRNGGTGADEYLANEAEKLTELLDIELVTCALAESGSDPRDVKGRNLVSLINAHLAEDGRIGKNLEEHCWGMIALKAADEQVSSKSVGWLVSQQREDGGWADSDDSLVRDTAIAMEALVATGEAETDVMEASLLLLRERMSTGGGFAASTGETNAQLTGSVMRGLYAAGDDPASSAWTSQGGNPVSYLNGLQAADGHERYSSGAESQPALTTAMAVPAMLGKHLPLDAPQGVATLGPGEPGSPVRDLGTAGVGMKPSAAALEKKPKSGEDATLTVIPGSSAGAVAKRTSWFSSLWLFLILCLAYAIVLIVVALIVSSAVSRGNRPAFPGGP